MKEHKLDTIISNDKNTISIKCEKDTKDCLKTSELCGIVQY